MLVSGPFPPWTSTILVIQNLGRPLHPNTHSLKHIYRSLSQRLQRAALCPALLQKEVNPGLPGGGALSTVCWGISYFSPAWLTCRTLSFEAQSQSAPGRWGS